MFKKWDLARIIRLVVGAVIALYALIGNDYLFLVLGGLFIFQSVLNISCCGAGGCASDLPHERNVYGDQIKQYKPENK